MAAYWFAFLVPGVLLLGLAAFLQLRNMKNLSVGMFRSFADTPDPSTFPNVSKIGAGLFSGFLAVMLSGLFGSVLVVIGIITLIVHLVK